MRKYLKVSLKQLKQELSSVAAEAAAGVTVHVTRYNKPFLSLTRADDEGLLVGKNVAGFSLKPLIGLGKRESKESIVRELLKDRS